MYIFIMCLIHSMIVTCILCIHVYIYYVYMCITHIKEVTYILSIYVYTKYVCICYIQEYWDKSCRYFITIIDCVHGYKVCMCDNNTYIVIPSTLDYSWISLARQSQHLYADTTSSNMTYKYMCIIM
jgi:hypothetical protein